MILLDFLQPRQTINSDCYFVVMTKLKASTSSQAEEKTTLLLQNNNARPSTSLKTMDHTANLGWTSPPHPLYSLDLVLSDFYLFGPMKYGVCGQHFPGNNAVIEAEKQWVISTGADFYGRSMDALVHRW